MAVVPIVVPLLGVVFSHAEPIAAGAAVVASLALSLRRGVVWRVAPLAIASPPRSTAARRKPARVVHDRRCELLGFAVRLPMRLGWGSSDGAAAIRLRINGLRNALPLAIGWDVTRHLAQLVLQAARVAEHHRRGASSIDPPATP